MAKMLMPRSFADLSSAASDVSRNAIAMNPELPSGQLAQVAVEDCDRDLVSGLSRVLLLRFFERLIRAERASARRKLQQLPLPGFNHLPKRIPINEKKRRSLEDATYSDLRSYVRRLSVGQRERLKNDPKLAEAKKLLELMGKYNGTSEGITVKEVFALEARK